MSTSPLVSVVIPTRNSAASLRACLDSIARQSYPSIEILVIDNESTDATLAIARTFTPHVYTRGPERSAQRNAGAQAAQGAYLVFIDSDMVLAPSVIERCVTIAKERPDVKGVIIPELSTGEGFWARCKALERSCYVGDDMIEAARFFERKAFEAAGAYDETLTGPEDWDLSQRVARTGTVSRVDAYITHLEGRLTLIESMRSKFYYGKTLGRYARKQPGSAARQLQLVRPAFVRHWRRLLAHPVLAGGMIVMKSCEYAAGGSGLFYSCWQFKRTSRTA